MIKPTIGRVVWLWPSAELATEIAYRDKTLPCMVPFADLPAAQQAKDYIFRAIVHAMRDSTHQGKHHAIPN